MGCIQSIKYFYYKRNTNYMILLDYNNHIKIYKKEFIKNVYKYYTNNSASSILYGPLCLYYSKCEPSLDSPICWNCGYSHIGSVNKPDINLIYEYLAL